jgi:polyphosphate kinase
MPLLASDGIEILRWKELSVEEQDDLHQLFRDRIYPVLTPLVVDPAHPFPYISGLSLSLAVMIADPESGVTSFARVKVPPLLPRFLTVGKYRFVPIEDVIAAHLDDLFTGLDILEHHVFRVTRTCCAGASSPRSASRSRSPCPPRYWRSWSPSWKWTAARSTTCPGRST